MCRSIGLPASRCQMKFTVKKLKSSVVCRSRRSLRTCIFYALGPPQQTDFPLRQMMDSTLSGEDKQSVKWRDKVAQNIRTHKLNFVHTGEDVFFFYIRQYLAIGYKNTGKYNNHQQWDASGRCLTQTHSACLGTTIASAWWEKKLPAQYFIWLLHLYSAECGQGEEEGLSAFASVCFAFWTSNQRLYIILLSWKDKFRFLQPKT